MPTTTTGGKTTRPKSTATKTTTRKSSAKQKKLVIVESPAKARTIERYLGADYSVVASVGHVRDLPKSTMGVDLENDFTPKYTVPRDKSKLVKDLKASVANASEVILATDPDREGEAIAWHVVQATGAETKPLKRVVFHEITPGAVQAAMNEPREIDMDLVDAQQARRVLDRIVGYSVSPLLWKKVKRGLSAGRVQTAALRIVVDRERLIQEFVPVEYWSLDALLLPQNARAGSNPFKAGLHKIARGKAELKTGEQTNAIVADLEGAAYQIASITKRESQRRPSAPFTTSTLQQEASRKLGYQVRRTSSLAQELYEGVDLGDLGQQGLITYIRTDSTNVSEVAQQAARGVIEERFGKDSLPARPPVYTRKAKGAQEAHEAIRPVDVSRDPESVRKFLSQPQFRLYQLIWQRFVASQMANAILDGTTVDIAAGKNLGANLADAPYTFRATGSVVRFPGYMAVYQQGRDEGDAADELDDGALPNLTEQQQLDLQKLSPEQHFTQPPPRYTEASLVKALEEAGIGRPSTYAPTIATLLARGYVTVDEKKLVPGELGFVVSDLLAEHFPNVFDIGFTSQMEEELDEIASGDRPWVPTLREFYEPFSATMKLAEVTMDRVKLKDELAGIDCEKCGRPMLIKMGKYGKFQACSGFPECRNAKPLLITVEIKCPTCHEGDVVERRSKKGRVFYGCSRWPDCDFVSWDKPVDHQCPKCANPYMNEVGRRGQLKCPACGHIGSTLVAAS